VGRLAGQRGREAEAAAAAWLEGRGFRVLDRNHATRRGEVDLVCQEGSTLCFVEVRSLSRVDRGTPAETVTPAKARRVVAAATDWAVRHRAMEAAIRFDVVAVEWAAGGPRFTLYRGAFDAGGGRW